MIRYLNLGLKKETVETHLMRSLHLPSVEKFTSENVYFERAIVLVVVKIGTKFEIAQILKGNTRVVVKLKQVVLMITQRRIVFMLSAVEVSKRLLPLW